jgi:hypothetical protein
MRLLGKSVTVFVSEINNHQPQDAIGWILEGGPKISIKNAAKFINTVQLVRIQCVISDKLVEGQIEKEREIIQHQR